MCFFFVIYMQCCCVFFFLFFLQKKKFNYTNLPFSAVGFEGLFCFCTWTLHKTKRIGVEVKFLLDLLTQDVWKWNHYHMASQSRDMNISSWTFFPTAYRCSLLSNTVLACGGFLRQGCKSLQVCKKAQLALGRWDEVMPENKTKKAQSGCVIRESAMFFTNK